MNTAQDILEYTQSHNIQMSALNGKLILEGELTDELLEKAREHKSDLLLFTIVNNVCVGLDMTPEQLIRVLNKQAKEQIISGEFSASILKKYAIQIDFAITAGVVNLIAETAYQEART